MRCRSEDNGLVGAFHTVTEGTCACLPGSLARATAVAFPAFTPDPTIILYLNDEEIVIIEVLHHYHMSFGLTSIDLPMYSYALFRVSGGP